MRFEGGEKRLTREEIGEVERRLDLYFPQPLVELFTASNGGRPAGADASDPDICDLLPLISLEGAETALDVHELFVAVHRLVPRNLFPFANDAGGDFFFVDCATDHGGVWVYRHDTAFEHLRNLEVGLEAFLARGGVEHV